MCAKLLLDERQSWVESLDVVGVVKAEAAVALWEPDRLVVFLPIIMTVARRFGGSLLLYGLPAAELLEGNIGLTLLVGAPIAVVSWYVGAYLVSRVIGRRVHVDIPEALFGHINGGRDEATDRDGTSAGGVGGGRTVTRAAPSFATVLGVLLLPFMLISFNTVLDTLMTAGVIEEGATWAEYLMLLGNTSVALLITVIVLRSQFDTLEPLEPDESGIAVDTASSVDDIAERVKAALRST